MNKDPFLDDEYYQALRQIPNYLFWKDTHSVFLGANISFAKIAGFKCVDQVIGKTDYDMPWANTHADLYQKRDSEILKNNQTQTQIETQLQASGKLVTVIVTKTQLLNKRGKVIGIVGSFLEMPAIVHPKKFISLPTSQREVLFAAAKGLSAKQIALTMHLSPRTVEFYINILKKKFACRTKAELIAMVWQFGGMH